MLSRKRQQQLRVTMLQKEVKTMTMMISQIHRLLQKVEVEEEAEEEVEDGEVEKMLVPMVLVVEVLEEEKGR